MRAPFVPDERLGSVAAPDPGYWDVKVEVGCAGRGVQQIVEHVDERLSGGHAR